MTQRKGDRAEAARRFVAALRQSPPCVLRAFRQAAARPLGADLASSDAFNEIWRPLRGAYRISRLACWLVATLYPWHPTRDGAASFGISMRAMAVRSSDSDKVKQRFSLLLASTGRDRDARLLEAVRLLAAEHVDVHWPRLLLDISRWYAPGRPVQREWANDFLGNERGGNNVHRNTHVTEPLAGQSEP